MNTFLKTSRFLTTLTAFLLLPAALLPVGGLAAQTAAETVQQALEDLRSDNPETRRGGVMLIAKYPGQEETMKALLKALEDPEPAVRRAAVVSLSENAPRIQPAQARILLRSLEDPDPEVRLGTAAWLPQLTLLALRNSGNRNPPITDGLRKAIEEPLLAALSDSQSLVRLKAVESLRYLRWRLPTDPLLDLMQDPDPEIRLQAYPVLSSVLTAGEFAAGALESGPDPDHRVRLALAETLATQPAPETRPLLQELAGDARSEVRWRAQAGLFLLSPENGLPDELHSALMEKEIDRGLLFRLFNAIRSLPAESGRVLAASLLEADNASTRARAATIWLRTFSEPPPSEGLLDLLADDAPEVRQQALHFAATRPALVAPATLFALPENPFMDVRLKALDLAGSLPGEDQARLALQLLLDTEPDVRKAALERIAHLQPAGWPGLLRASLRDPSSRIQRAAAAELLENLGDEGRRIAGDFARDHPDQPIASWIRERLRSAP